MSIPSIKLKPENIKNNLVESASDRLMDILESIISIVEYRQAARSEILDAATEGLALSSHRVASHDSVSLETLGGPLTSSDLSKLSLLRAEIANKIENGINGWDSADPDTMLQITSMLEKHVSAASNVNLIKEVHRFTHTKKSECSQSSASRVDEVRKHWKFILAKHFISSLEIRFRLELS
jgi:hypothetical protein